MGARSLGGHDQQRNIKPAVNPRDHPSSAAEAIYVFAPLRGKWVETQELRPGPTDPTGNFDGFGPTIAVGPYGALIAPYSTDVFGSTLGQTDGYIWSGNRLVFQQAFPNTPGDSVALSSSPVGIIGTVRLHGR